MEGHGAFGNLNSAQQLGSVTSYWNFFSSHAYLPGLSVIADSSSYDSLPFMHSKLSLHLRRGGFCFRGLLLNPFKHILDNSIAAHGMKIECILPFHSSTRVKSLAQQRPRSMEANLDIVFGDLEDIGGIGRA